jgi:hypothetical protein
MERSSSYSMAQRAIADLKAAIVAVLDESKLDGLTNVAIGRALGIYHGHVRHEGHIPRTMLALLEEEGVVEQNSATKRWRMRKIGEHVEDPE